MSTLFVHTDGGSRGNPGPSACGCVFITQSGEVVFEEKSFLGIGTNNEAEYQGLLLALLHLPTILQSGTYSEVEFRLDSNLVVQQVLGNWKIKDSRMRTYVMQARQEANALSIPWTIRYVPRAENAAADALVNQALDAALV